MIRPADRRSASARPAPGSGSSSGGEAPATTVATPASSRVERCARARRSPCCRAESARAIAAIDTYDGELEEAIAPMSRDAAPGGRARRLARRADLPSRRGADGGARAGGGRLLDDRRAAAAGSRYLLKHTSRTVPVIVDAIDDLVDVHTLERGGGAAGARPQRHRPRAPAHELTAGVRPLQGNRRTGSFILIDEASNETVGAGMIA